MMDLMCPFWIMLRASGLSIRMQCRTSRMPAQQQIHQLVKTLRGQRRTLSDIPDIIYCFLLIMPWRGRQEDVPEEDSSRSNLLTSQSRLLENCVQLFLFPRIKAAAGQRGNARGGLIEFSRVRTAYFKLEDFQMATKTERHKNNKINKIKTTHLGG